MQHSYVSLMPWNIARWFVWTKMMNFFTLSSSWGRAFFESKKLLTICDVNFSHLFTQSQGQFPKKIQFKVRTNQLHVPKTHTKINLISPTSQEQIYFLLKDYNTTFQMWSSTSFPANKSIWFKCNCVTRMTVNMTVGMKMREAIKCLHKNTIDGSNSTHESTSV